MSNEFWIAHKKAVLIVAGVVAVLFFLIWGGRLFNPTLSVEVTNEPVLTIAYCGAEPQELCVLSFGRDLANNLIISFFIPDRNFPEFYLKVTRAVGESMYECARNKEVPSSVYCAGDAIGLEETIDIDMVSKEDDRLLATGQLVVNAILLSPQIGVTGVVSATSTVTPGTISVRPTATATTLTPSYPGPSYP